jgi:DNA repair exonuclease SbcCD ATPase subunit
MNKGIFTFQYDSLKDNIIYHNLSQVSNSLQECIKNINKHWQYIKNKEESFEGERKKIARRKEIIAKMYEQLEGMKEPEFIPPENNNPDTWGQKDLEHKHALDNFKAEKWNYGESIKRSIDDIADAERRLEGKQYLIDPDLLTAMIDEATENLETLKKLIKDGVNNG